MYGSERWDQCRSNARTPLERTVDQKDQRSHNPGECLDDRRINQRDFFRIKGSRRLRCDFPEEENQDCNSGIGNDDSRAAEFVSNTGRKG